MVQAYNFLASWQLFPEKCNYEHGERPKSGIYKMEATDARNELIISYNWINIQNQGFASTYRIFADGGLHAIENVSLADHAQAKFPDGINFEIHFYNKGEIVLHIIHEIMPNGYLKITQQGMITVRPTRILKSFINN